MSIKIWPLMIFMAAVAVRWNFSFYFMMARSVAEKYWLSEIARKESRFLSTGYAPQAASTRRRLLHTFISLLCGCGVALYLLVSL